MSTFTRYFVDLTTPMFGGPGLFTFPLQDFVIHAEAGTIAQLGLRGINRHSTVLASITELTSAPGHPVDFPFVGAAPMEIRNVAPRDDGFVSLWVHMEWFAPLNYRINLIVSND